MIYRLPVSDCSNLLCYLLRDITVAVARARQFFDE